MKKTTIFAYFFFLSLLAGCQQTPDEVRERMGSYGSGKQIEKPEKTYYTIEELRNASIEDIDHVPDNLKLPGQVDFSGIEGVSNLTLKRYENYGTHRDDIAAMLGVDNPDWSMVEGDSSWYEYEDAEKDIYLAVDENGAVTFICDDLYEDSENGENPSIVQRIYLGRQECPVLMCRMGNQEILLQDLIDYADNWIEHCEYCQDEFDYEAKTVFVKEKEDKSNRISMVFQKMYKGVGLNYIALGNGGWDMESLQYEGVSFEMMMDEMEVQSLLRDETKVSIEKEEPIDKVLAFDSAVDLVEQTLSGFPELTVCEIRVEYMIQAEKGENEENNTYMPGAVFHTIPVYSFLMEFPEEYDDKLGILECNEYVYVNVDMRDGTIITNFEDRRFHGFQD